MAPTIVPITFSAMRRSLTSLGSRSAGRDRARSGSTELKADQPRQHRVFDRLTAQHPLPLDVDFAQQIGEQQPAGSQTLDLHGRILLHVVEEMLERRLDPQIHLRLVGNHAVVCRERRVGLAVDRRSVIRQHLRRQLE